MPEFSLQLWDAVVGNDAKSMLPGKFRVENGEYPSIIRSLPLEDGPLVVGSDDELPQW